MSRRAGEPTEATDLGCESNKEKDGRRRLNEVDDRINRLRDLPDDDPYKQALTSMGY